jgi:hypothetical protein
MITSLRRSQLFNVIPSTIDFTRNHSTAVANRRTGLARSCRHCYLLRSASHCTSTALARSAQHSLCPSWTGRGPLRCAAPRSGGRPGSSRRPGRWAERGPAGRLSLSLSLLASGWRRRCWLQGTGAEGVAVFGGPGLADLLELR